MNLSIYNGWNKTMGNNVSFSYNPFWIGKPEKKVVANKTQMTYDGHKVNLGYGWKNITLSWADAFESITVDGYSFAPVLVSKAHGHKNEQNFLSHSIAAVDIDKGMTIPQLLDDEFYNIYGAGFYTSPSHTSRAHKFRILFRPQMRITDVNDMRDLYTALIKWYGGDLACVDGCRLFFGAINAPLYERTDKIVPMKIVDQLIKQTRDDISAQMLSHHVAEYSPQTNSQREKIINLLQKTYIGKYPVWFAIGCALRRAGYTLAEFQYATTGMMNKKSPGDAAVVWGGWKADHTNKATIGSVIWLLKERWGDLLSLTEQNKPRGFNLNITHSFKPKFVNTATVT